VGVKREHFDRQSLMSLWGEEQGVAYALSDFESFSVCSIFP
jgi:hypothetical protein